MPTYDYICENCDHQFELFQPITARPAKKCPKCGKMSLKRLIGTGAGVIFKGSGFYQTDYRTESYKQDEKGEKDAADAKKTKDKKTAESIETKKDAAKKSDKKSEKKKSA
jgi:putative FmdB family regulatory protein